MNSDVDYIVDLISRNNETRKNALLGKSTVFTMQECLFLKMVRVDRENKENVLKTQ